MATPSARAREEFRFRRLQKPEEFRQVEEVERLAFGLGTEPSTPVSVQRSFQDQGGIVLGAFSDIFLAGFTVGFLGWDGSTLYHYSHLTAVRPEYQNHHLGFRLKAAQRDEVLQQGLGEIRWAFDPLQSRTALLAVRRLGARPDGYKVHYFGRLDTAADAESETDRLTVRWPLADPTVVSRLGGQRPTGAEDAARVQRAAPILESEVGENGLRVPTVVSEPAKAEASLEIPFDVGLLRAHQPTSLHIWRSAVRDGFRAAFDLGYQVDDFAVVSADHERRSFYLFSRAPATPPPPAATPT